VGNTRSHIAKSILLLSAVCGAVSLAGPSPQTNEQDPQVNIQPRSAPAPKSNDTADRTATRLRVDSNLVLIPVVVTDHKDRLITGLEREHFKIYDDKVEQEITHFAAEDVPVSISVLFDCSSSMGQKLQRSRAAVSAFLKTANTEDEFSLIQFADRAQLVVPFTTSSEEIQNRMTFLQAHGRTALLDAICLALNELRHGKHTRKAILIISDGGDNSSRYTVRDIKNRVREEDVQIYSIGIMDPISGRIRSIEELAGPALLDELAHLSGGRLFEVDNLNELPDIASKIGMALRNQYVLGYSPSADKRDGKYHSVKVKVARPKGLPPLRASFRTGYLAPSN